MNSKQNDRRYDVAMDILLEGVQIIDPDWRYIYLNKTAAGHGHNTPQEMIGKSMPEIYPGIEKTEMFAVLRDCMQSRRARQMENEFIYPDGSKSWFRLSFVPVPEGVLILSVDISKSKQAEEYVIKSEALLKEIAANYPNSYVSIIEKDLTVSFISGQEIAKQGLDVDEIIGKTPDQILEEQAPILRENYLKTFDGIQTRFELLIDDQYQFFRTVPLKNRDGEISRILVVVENITERKRTEEALRESKENLQLLIDHVPAAFAMFDNEMRYIAHSQRWLTEFNLQENNLAGKSHYEIFPELSDELKSIHQRGLNGEKMAETGSKFERMDGSVQWMNWEMLPWYTSNNSIGGIVIFNEDITDLKQAEESLRSNEERMRLFIEHAPAALAMFDRDMKYLAVSKRWIYDYQLDDQDIIGRSVYDVFPEFPEHWKEVHQRGLAGEIVRADEEKFVREDGSLQWLSWEVRPWRNANNEVSGIVIFTVDITKNKLAEDALRESEEKFSTLFDKASYAILLSTMPDGVIVNVNESFEKIFGFSKQEAMGSTAFLLGSHPKMDEHTLATLKEQGFVHNLETQYRTKSGEYRFFLTNLDLITIGDQKYILQAMQDISERKKRENERKTLLSLANALRNAPTRTEMLPTILDQCIRLMNLDGAALALLDEDSGDIVIELARGKLAPGNQLRIPSGEGITGKVINSGETYITDDLSTDPEHFRSDLLKNVKSAACALLIAENEVIGALWISSPKPFEDSDVHLLEGIADMAATAIHRYTLHEQILIYAKQVTEAYEKNIEAWSAALDMRDKETEGHTLRVTELTIKLARAMGIPESELVHIRRGALLHDIGKMGVPDHILLKPGKLTEEEWVKMRQHPSFAYKLLSPIEFLGPAIDIPFCHHEKWDGTGYPRGLKGEQIPVGARLFSVVDVWDALISDRPYRGPWPRSKALKYIREQSGTHFEPRAVEEFLKLIEKNEMT